MDSPTPSASDILRHFQGKSSELLEELQEFIRFDTPSGDAARVGAFVGHYRSLLEGSGVRCRELGGPAGPQLFGERPGEDPPLVLVGHADTVWPAGEPERRPPEVRDGRLYGPGTYDMKSGLGLIRWALGYLQDQAVPYRRRLLVFLSADEETGSVTARPHMDSLLPRDATALVPEPPCPDGSMKIARKGVGIFELRVIGREAHAGAAPEKGISAIAEMARLVLEVESWKDPGRGILLNVGTIEGGTASNVVPGEARSGVDVRYDTLEDGEVVEARLRGLRPEHPEARLEVSGSLAFPPLVPTPLSRFLAARVGEIAREELGIDVGAGSSGGGSDGSYLSARGLTVLDGLGVDGAGAHARDEHVVVERLPLRAALFTRLLLELGGFPERAAAASLADSPESPDSPEEKS
ncbi:MAG: M20/M25/M40 family metallo-hydrolase [Planctomycetota bacterium]|nr:M20/M25/M40 family metallo-hydrolase [Planctomycetota bacterium]